MSESESEAVLAARIEDVKHKLEDAVCAELCDVSTALALLQDLREQTLTLSLLKQTGIGVSVGKLRKHEDEQLRVLAQQLVLHWKELVPLSSRKRRSSSIEGPRKQPSQTEDKAKKSRIEQQSAQKFIPAEASEPTINEKALNVKDCMISFCKKDAYTGDKTRDRIRELLAKALTDILDETSQFFVAAQLEDALAQKFGGVGQDYKNQFRNILFNLKDTKNPDFRGAVCRGLINPVELASMTAMDMASSDLKKERSERWQYMKDAARSDWNRGRGATDMFTCGRCKKSETVYYQMQTRSADEPMTTFVTCLNCDNRWKC